MKLSKTMKINRLDSKNKILKIVSPFLIKSGNKKPKVQFFEGKKGVRDVFLDNLNATGELLTIAGEGTFNDFIIKEVPNYITERVKRKILLKLIVPDSERMRNWKSKDRNELRITKIVTNNLYPLNLNIDIYNNRVTLTSFENLFALLIIDAEVANSMRSVFYLLWDNLHESKLNAKIYDKKATRFLYKK